jgi:hypothetical protein
MSKNVEGFESPERAALATAIAKRDEAMAQASARTTAIEGLQSKTWALQEAIEKAEKAVEIAKAAAAAHLVAKARGNAGPAPKTVAQARADLLALQDELEAAQSARGLLEAEQQAPSLFSSPKHLQDEARKAALHVLATSPAFNALHAEIRQAAAALREKGAIFLAFFRAGLYPTDLKRNPAFPNIGEDWEKAIEGLNLQPDYQAAKPWSDALDALCANASAPVPGDEPPRGGVVAALKPRRAG